MSLPRMATRTPASAKTWQSAKRNKIELKLAKRTADAKLRKVHLAFKVPKKPAKKATAHDGDSYDTSENGLIPVSMMK